MLQQSLADLSGHRIVGMIVPFLSCQDHEARLACGWWSMVAVNDCSKTLGISMTGVVVAVPVVVAVVILSCYYYYYYALLLLVLVLLLLL